MADNWHDDIDDDFCDDHPIGCECEMCHRPQCACKYCCCMNDVDYEGETCGCCRAHAHQG